VGVAGDAKAAKKWYRKAAHQGVAAAQYELALLHLKESKGAACGAGRSTVEPTAAANAEAAAWFRRAAEQGYAKVGPSQCPVRVECCGCFLPPPPPPVLLLF
jgi:hypothetical protein